MLQYLELDGFVLHDIMSADRTYMVGEVSGLTGIPVILGDPYKRAQGDGVVEPPNSDLDARYSNITMIATGNTVALARVNWTNVNRVLLKAVRTQKLLKWQWLNDTLLFQAAVKVSVITPPDISADSQGSRFSQVVTFRHADPANYDQSSTTIATGAPSLIAQGLPLPIPFPIPWALVGSGAGTVAVTNNGDNDAWPVIEISGPISNPIVQNQTLGKTIYIDGIDLAAGESILIDTNPASQAVTVGGVNKFGAVRLSASNFFPVSAGETQSITFSGDNTDPAVTTMTVSLRSAYVT